MKVLLLVDVQNDFCPGGALPVPDGDQVVPVLNRLMESGLYDTVIATKDWHPAGHGSFASSHPGKAVYSLGELSGLPQVLWPDHCVENTRGSDFHPQLRAEFIDRVIHKGTDPQIDSYSGFFDNAKKRETELREVITRLVGGEAHLRDVTVDVAGLATDYCAGSTALHSLELGFKTRFIVDASRAVNLKPNDERDMLRSLVAAGAALTTSRELLSEVPKSRDRRGMCVSAR